MIATRRNSLPKRLCGPKCRIVLAVLLAIFGTLQPIHALRHLQEGGTRSAWFDVLVHKPALRQALAVLLELPEGAALAQDSLESPAVRNVCLLEAGFHDQDAFELPTEVGVLPVPETVVSQPSPEPIQRPRDGARGIASARAPPSC